MLIRRLQSIVFLLTVFTLYAVNARAGSVDDCASQGFQNAYYFPDDNELRTVSLFFQQIPGDSFNDNENHFISLTGDIHRSEVYYDDVEQSLLKHGKELFLTQSLSLPKYRKGRERVVFNDYNKSKITSMAFDVKVYKRKMTALDKHELFGKVKRNQRQLLLQTLSSIIVEPVDKIVPQLRVSHHEIMKLFRIYGQDYGAVTLDNFTVSNFGMANNFTLLKFELNQDKLKVLSITEKLFLYQLFCGYVYGLNELLPDMTPMQKFGYLQYQQLVDFQLPSREYFKRHPVMFKLGQIVLLTLIGFLFIYLLLGRYQRRDNYRHIKVHSFNRDDDA